MKYDCQFSLQNIENLSVLMAAAKYTECKFKIKCIQISKSYISNVQINFSTNVSNLLKILEGVKWISLTYDC